MGKTYRTADYDPGPIRAIAMESCKAGEEVQVAYLTDEEGYDLRSLRPPMFGKAIAHRDLPIGEPLTLEPLP